ncbi:MAG: hypothetical protein ACRD30_02475 [Bryobacteraceae bacterium]
MREFHLWRRKPALIYPIPPAPRTAVLIPGFRRQRKIRVFASGWCEAARRFAPQSIAGTLAQIDELAHLGISPTHAVIVLGRERDPRLTQQDRDRLWDALHVPVFEQIIAEDCTLLAAECEAHDGLHVESPDFITGANQIDETPCGCGRPTPRLISPERVETLRRAAAQAR